jgi:tetratricopeptide (TPR) repeat protein
MENYNRGGDSTDTINTLDEAAKLAEGETKIESLKNLAFVYISEDEQKEALKTFKEALSLISDKSLNYYLISGNIAELEGNSQAALADYNKALTIDPNDFQTNNSLGTLYLGLSTSTEKFTDYNKALKYNKKAYDIDKQEAAIGNLALSYYFLENYDQTISLLLQTSLENKGSNNFWLGLAYLNKKDFIHARIYFQKAVNLGMEVPPEVQSFLDNSNDQ